MSEPIYVVDYDASWPLNFAMLADRVRQSVPGYVIVAIEHIGSTSVPGLAAKPVIDMDVVISAPKDLAAVTSGLAAIGYVYQGNNGIADRDAFLWPPGESRHHLYVCSVSSAELRRHLAFRDYMRTHPSEVKYYGILKRHLAELYRSDRLAYNDAKTDYVEAILRKARQ